MKRVQYFCYGCIAAASGFLAYDLSRNDWNWAALDMATLSLFIIWGIELALRPRGR